MWWQDLLWGLWNGITAWVVLIVHIFGGWDSAKIYDELRRGNWYDLGFLIGAGSPFLGTLGGKSSSSARTKRRALTDSGERLTPD